MSPCPLLSYCYLLPLPSFESHTDRHRHEGKNKELCLCSMFYVAHKYGIHESIRSLPASPLVGSSIRSHCRLLPTTTLVPILSCKPHRTREHEDDDLSERLQEPFTLFAIRQQHNNSLIHQPRQSTLNTVVVNV